MKNEIDRDFYCSAYFYINDPTSNNQCQGRQLCSSICKRHHRKWPTPEQYKEEYGEGVPDDMPVWLFCTLFESEDWEVDLYKNYFDLIKSSPVKIICVIACTPFGKPDAKWRPE